MWFRKPKARPPEHWTAPQIRFIGEQDGASEKDLKLSLIELFRNYPALERAYLARVQYEDADAIHVALCLAGPTDHNIERAAGQVFARTFRSDCHLDIFFLQSPSQEEELAQVCRPFFVASRPSALP